jgi:probable addiction module antidote protein
MKMMHTDLKPYDPADLLKTEDDIYAYLNDALNDEDPAVFIIALADVVKMKGLAAVSEDAGLQPEVLYQAISGDTNPPWQLLHRIMKSLDIHLQAVA